MPVTSGNTFDSVRSHSYSVSGNFNQVTDPNGNISTSVEDAFGRLSQIIQPAPVTGGTPLTTSYGYDSNGNQTTVTNANGEQTKMAYDALNRQISKTLPDPTSNTPGTGPATTTSYDAAGNVVATADALGNDTTFVYNAWNQLVDQEQPIPAGGSIMGPITVPQTQYTYNAMGDLTSVQDPDGNTTSYTFNQLNEKTQETDPTVTALYEGTVQSVTPTKQYQYDLNGNVTQMTDGDGKVTNYTYDNLNRLTQETWQDSSSGPITNTISYTYDKDGHLTGGSDGNSSTTLNYNGQNQLAGASITFNGISATVATTLGYDQAGNNTSLKTTVNGTADLQNVYTYDNLNRLSSIVQSGQGGHAVAGKAIGFTYTNIGQINAITRYAGASTSGTMAAVTTNTYDHDDRLTQISNALGATGSTTVADSFGYDADGRITGESSTAEGSATLSYDRDNQLLSVTPTAAGTVGEFNPESYTYDLAGNRLSAQTGLATSSSTVSEGTGNELQSNANYSYTYDEDGNLSTRTNASNGAIDTYTWDNRDRLIEDQTKSADGTVIQTVTYTYSPITNQRLSETITTSSGTTTEYYFYDPNGNLLLVLNASGGVKERELTGQGLSQILASETNINGNGAGTVNWALTNQVGSVTDWVNNSGSVVGHVRYDSFGNIESQTGISSAMRFGYAGMQVDAATGLYYDNARYYDPQTGTFISQDPLSFGGGDYNLKRYASGSPVDRIDPTGLAITVFDYPTAPSPPASLYEPDMPGDLSQLGVPTPPAASEQDLPPYHQADTQSSGSLVSLLRDVRTEDRFFDLEIENVTRYTTCFAPQDFTDVLFGEVEREQDAMIVQNVLLDPTIRDWAYPVEAAEASRMDTAEAEGTAYETGPDNSVLMMPGTPGYKALMAPVAPLVMGAAVLDSATFGLTTELGIAPAAYNNPAFQGVIQGTQAIAGLAAPELLAGDALELEELQAFESTPLGCFRAGTTVLSVGGVHRPIEKVRLGQRVAAADKKTESDPIDSAVHRIVHLQFVREGQEFHMSFLRHAKLLEGIGAGDTMQLEVFELQIKGPARVTGVEPCPETEPGPGRLVTGMFRSENVDMRRLTIVGLQEPIDITANHPVWSEDHMAFVSARVLQPGGKLRTVDGFAVVESNVKLLERVEVFNLEIDGAHQYYVTPHAVLVHNAGGNNVYGGPSGFSNVIDGQAVHELAFPNTLCEQTGTSIGDWEFKVKPGETGVDAKFTGNAGGQHPGFDYAELKPRTDWSYGQFMKQYDRWTTTGEIAPNTNTQLWFYSNNGVVGTSGINYSVNGGTIVAK